MAERQHWRPVLFDCPRTGHKVQGLLAEEGLRTDDVHYESVTCLACSGVHFVHPVSGKVLDATRELSTNVQRQLKQHTQPHLIGCKHDSHREGQK